MSLGLPVAIEDFSTAVAVLGSLEEYTADLRRVEGSEEYLVLAFRDRLRDSVAATIRAQGDRYYRLRGSAAGVACVFAPATFAVTIETNHEIEGEGVVIEGWTRPYTDARAKIELARIELTEMVPITREAAMTDDPILFACIERLTAGDDSVIDN